MSLTGDLLRGHTEAIILFQLLKSDGYGYEISKKVAELSGGFLVLKEATLYTAFRRLEESGQISSYWGEGDGARRRYYTITDIGKAKCKEIKTEWLQTKSVLDTLIKESSDGN
ncbi:MAG: PadR family transcriptional regulator [Clostridia bacterium]|nr:PadR family transcriptional regulator [Clostridia bacterium]